MFWLFYLIVFLLLGAIFSPWFYLGIVFLAVLIA